MAQSKTLLLIDGHALAFREYYALERTGMHSSEGVPTWAVFGFFKAMFDLIKKAEFEIDAIVVTFDVSHKTFRTEAYKEYKANREQMPDDMSRQMELIFEGLEAFEIPVYKKEGFEADDVIGTISKKALEAGHKTLILTGDQDSFQLVDKEGFVKVIIPFKGELIVYDWDKVYEKLGVYPNQVIDYKALRGDTSDNIPGIKGIGEKSARVLLEHYNDLDNIYENTDTIKSLNIKDKIISGKEMAYKSRYLATIVRDVDVDFDFEHACLKLPDMNNVKEFLTKYQLLSFLKNLKTLTDIFNRISNNCNDENQKLGYNQLGLFSESEQNNIYPWQGDRIEINFLDSGEKVNDFSNLINENTGLFIYSAAKAGDILSRKIDYIIFGVKKITKDGLHVKFIETENNYAEFFILPMKNRRIPKIIKNILRDEKIPKFTYDLKNEYNLFSIYNSELKNVLFDPVLADYIENSSAKHEIETQALIYLKISPVDDPLWTGYELTEEYKKNVRNLWLTIRLAQYYYENTSDTNLKLLDEMEIPLAKVLSNMELNGVKLDKKYLEKMKLFLEQNIKEVVHNIYVLADEVFNINSTLQLGHILFEKLKLPVKKHKSKNKYFTDANTLEELAKDYEIAKYVLEYRKYNKLRTTYTTGLIKLISPVDNKIHTTFNQTVAVTGRLSSSSPNLQNIPTRTEDGEKIRTAFIPESYGNKLVSADYSQIELRILAHISQDKNLLEAFKNDCDVHTLTASRVFEVPAVQVTKKMRMIAKAVNFGIIYGQTNYGLSQTLGITNAEAANFIEKYFATYPDVRTYMNDTAQKVALDGYTETIWGRRRYLSDEINSANVIVREFAKRAAINFPMQGSAADLMKLAMINFYNGLINNKLESKLILQVHDEMVVDAVEDEIPFIKQLLYESMEFKDVLSVPLKIDIGVGDTWRAV